MLAIHLEGEAQFRQHIVVTTKRQERARQHHAAFNGGRLAEQPQPTRLDGLLKLPGIKERLSLRDKFRFHVNRDPTPGEAPKAIVWRI